MTHHYRRFTAVACAATFALGCGVLTGPDNPDALAIQRFLATPDKVDAGKKVMLLWSVEGAEKVTIDHGIGEVEPRGSHPVSPSATTTYTLSASGGTSSATSTVKVIVGGDDPTPNTPSPSPSPSQSPSPSPTPTPSPSPSPSASPSPSPSPSASPSPSPTPGQASPSPTPTPGQTLTCGTPVASPDQCALSVETPAGLKTGECVQLTRLTASPACPVQNGAARIIGFDITAHSSSGLLWRKAASSADTVAPSSGGLLSQGTTTVRTDVTVADAQAVYEVIDASGRVVLRFTLRHR